MKIYFSLLLILSPFTTSAQSDNFLGGVITYSNDPVSNEYAINLTLYNDCTKDSISSVQKIYISSFNCFTDSINMQLIQSSDITPYLPNMNSPCDTGNNPVPAGVLQSIYSGMWTPDTTCSNYLLAWMGCCRSTGITNSAYKADIIIGTSIENPTMGNNSPVILNSIVTPYYCEEQMKINPFSHGIFDPDQVDSLAFELKYCHDNTLSPIFYNVPYSLQNPVSTDSNGVVNKVQQSIQCMEIREYRNGQLIGSVFAERLINVTECDFNLTGVNPAKEENQLNIYPNPFSSEINISNPAGAEAALKVYDLAGKLHIFKKYAGAENITIDAAHLPTGIYFAEIVTEDRRSTVKLIKIQ